MDKRIRVNEICIIGLPRCDFAFSSSRTCFIGYGFEASPLEMQILRNLLSKKGIEPVEAGGKTAPGQNAFCAKICSKIITSQFCIILINNDERDGKEIPNANVNMEYGLMLGFNKYVIPFQRKSQKLPFNVAGLDTIKYEDKDFERLASEAIDQAISETTPEKSVESNFDQKIGLFLMHSNLLLTPLDNQGDKAMFEIGHPLGFNLLNDFSATKYKFFGNFTSLRPELALWRIKKLKEIIAERENSLEFRKTFGIITIEQGELLQQVFKDMQIIVLVTSNSEKNNIVSSIDIILNKDIIIYSMSDVDDVWSRF